MKKRWIIASVAVCTLATAGIVYSVQANLTQDNKHVSNEKSNKTSVALNVDKSQGDYRDGVFEGEVQGYGGLVKVKVTILDGKIDSVEVLSHNETPGYYENATEVIDAIVKNNSTNVDAIAGATITSDGIKNAVNDALNKALKNPKKEKILATDIKSKTKKAKMLYQL